jgi:hypothetical protein
MARSQILDEIRRLDPERDDQRIVFLSTCHEFPFDTTRALEFALFRTFAVPAISALLDRTGEFQDRAQKRYDDTDLLVSELMEWGYDSERGRRALRRMNQLHGRFDIPNDDFLYVLSTFVYEPIRWNARFGWRPLCEQERLGYFHFWREVGRRMNIKAHEHQGHPGGVRRVRAFQPGVRTAPLPVHRNESAGRDGDPGVVRRLVPRAAGAGGAVRHPRPAG